MKKSSPRLIVADDHAMFAETLRKFLSANYDVVVAGSGDALLDAAAEFKPDVVVADAGMMLADGLNAGCELKKRFPLVRLVCLTQHREPSMAVEVFRAGASAFLVKSSTITELLTAIRAALNDHIYISPSIGKEVMHALLQPRKRKVGERWLTARQREVLRLLAEGKSMKAIGEMLQISARTVQFHKYAAMKTLQVKSNAEIVRYAITHGIISS